jgi:hypothetical protein
MGQGVIFAPSSCRLHETLAAIRDWFNWFSQLRERRERKYPITKDVPILRVNRRTRSLNLSTCLECAGY